MMAGCLSAFAGKRKGENQNQISRKVPAWTGCHVNDTITIIEKECIMALSVELGNLEKIVDRLVESGRFNSKSEVLREGIRMIDERERHLEALDREIALGLADVAAGRVRDADEVEAELLAEFGPKPDCACA